MLDRRHPLNSAGHLRLHFLVHWLVACSGEVYVLELRYFGISCLGWSLPFLIRAFSGDVSGFMSLYVSHLRGLIHQSSSWLHVLAILGVGLGGFLLS